MFQVWYHWDFIFYNLPIGKEFRKTAHKFHNFTDRVIKIEKIANITIIIKISGCEGEEGSVPQ